MAENCQYCGGRLSKLHPAHVVFCTQRPKEVVAQEAALVDLYLSGRVSAAGPIKKPVTNPEDATLKRDLPEVCDTTITAGERRIIEALVLETMPEEPVVDPEDATKPVAHPRLVLPKAAKPTQAQKRARQRAAKKETRG